jgi:hypothetical protein
LDKVKLPILEDFFRKSAAGLAELTRKLLWGIAEAILLRHRLQFRLPWHRAAGNVMRPVNVASKKPYRGVNVMARWATAEEKGYTSGTWEPLSKVGDRRAGKLCATFPGHFGARV